MNKIPAEQQRLDENAAKQVPLEKWGPYLSERHWGTVREDYSAGGTAWDYFSHDHARSRAYRWGGDGSGGATGDRRRLCLGLALWSGRASIRNDRLLCLTNSRGSLR